MKTILTKIVSLAMAALSMAAFAVGCSFKKETCEHDYGATAKAITKVATCQEEGEELWACVKCGAEKTEKTELAAHSYDAGIVKKKATCKNVGEALYSCVHCDVTKIEAIPKAAHDVVEVAQLAPTCDVDGYTSYTYCKNCNEFLTPKVVIPCGGHIVVPVKGTPATCTSTGLTDGTKCIVCNEIFMPQEVIDAKGHTPVAVPGKAPTCSEVGLTNGSKCGDCGAVLVAQTEIPVLDHAYGDDCTCDVCGVESHNYGDDVFCDNCGAEVPVSPMFEDWDPDNGPYITTLVGATVGDYLALPSFPKLISDSIDIDVSNIKAVSLYGQQWDFCYGLSYPSSVLNEFTSLVSLTIFNFPANIILSPGDGQPGPRATVGSVSGCTALERIIVPATVLEGATIYFEDVLAARPEIEIVTIESVLAEINA